MCVGVWLGAARVAAAAAAVAATAATTTATAALSRQLGPRRRAIVSDADPEPSYPDSLERAAGERLVCEYVARTRRLLPLRHLTSPPLPPPGPPSLASELARDSLWSGKPQQYFESINHDADAIDEDSLAR